MQFLTGVIFALTMAAAEPTIIPLYPGPAPGSETWDWPETEQASTDGIRRIANVTRYAGLIRSSSFAAASLPRRRHTL